MLSQINLALWAWVESLRDLGRLRIWRPFLLLGLVQGLVLLLLSQFYRPGLVEILAPLLERMGGPAVLHYPQFFVALPGLFSQTNLVVDFLAGTFFIGVALVIIWRHPDRKLQAVTGPNEFSVVAKRYLPLLLVRLPLILLLYALAWQLPKLWVDSPDLTGNQVRLIRYSTFGLQVLLESLFIYAPVFLLLEGSSVPKAWGQGFAFLGRYPIASLLVVFVPNLLQIPTSFVLRRADRVVQSLSPELVGAMIGGAVLIYVLVNFVIIGSIIRIYGARRAEEGDAAWA